MFVTPVIVHDKFVNKTKSLAKKKVSPSVIA